MCGIFGIIALDGPLNVLKYHLPNGTEILKHRGPDDFGHYLDQHVYFGHRRLSIIDLSTGNQPMFNEDGSICVIFNGEIYNFQEIRKNLQKLGHHFQTNSDTETIIHAFEEWGRDCVDHFRGMFSFALWDVKKSIFFAARDRLGIKPFFYAVSNGVFMFASEMKAILQYPEISRDIDEDAMAAYFTLAYIPNPMTIYKQIRKLPPGHTLEIENGDIRIRKYWDLYFRPDRTKSEKYFIDGFMGLLEEAVKLRMISDVPLGAFLSGGIDSGTIVALMSRLSKNPVNTCCIGFGGDVGGYLDERVYAKEVAEKYHTDHREYVVHPDPQAIIEDIVMSFDEPFADHSTIPSYYLCKVTREKVTVALSGLGGDEVFGGYERYLGFKISSIYNRLPWFLRERVIRQVVEKIPERADGHYTVNHLKRFVRSAGKDSDLRYFGFLSMLKDSNLFGDPKAFQKRIERVEQIVLDYFNSDNAQDPLDRAFYCDIKTYLPEDILACTDRMSMRHSLEVRVPFIDHKLMEFCACIPSEMKIKWGTKKYILRKAADDFLPKDVIHHRKQGFVGPMTRWLQRDLKPFVQDLLSSDNLNKHALFNNSVVFRTLDEHFRRVEIHDKLLWALIKFQYWYQMYIENSSATHYTTL